MPSSEEQLSVLIRASYPALLVVSHEEGRVVNAVKRILDARAQATKRITNLWVWSETKGLVCLNKKINNPKMNGASDALDFMEKDSEPGVYVMMDFGRYLNDAYGPIQRKVKDVVGAFTSENANGSCLVMVDVSSDIPPRLEKLVTVVDFDYPTTVELFDRLLLLTRNFPDMAKMRDDQLRQVVQRGAECAAGLTMAEAENVFAKSLVMTRTISPDVIIHDKKAIVRRSGVLEYHDVSTDVADVGGLENLKAWLASRGRAFSAEARSYGLPTPKGVLVAGVAGTGKSLVAKSIGGAWGMPVLRMDVGALFGSLVGQSESNMRKALKTAEAMAPCVLWIDELEKSFGQSGGHDGGTTSRVFGSFLSWMQDKTAQVFVVATANDVSVLPPEMLRKGRLSGKDQADRKLLKLLEHPKDDSATAWSVRTSANA